MKVEIKEADVIPRQSTTDSLVEFARIHQIYPCNKDGIMINSRTEDSMYVKVYLSFSPQGSHFVTSGIVYSYTDYAAFKESYGLSEHALIGRPAFAVYRKDPRQSLVGIIPVGKKARVTLAK
ncbi:MAG TPA: hypothetical protein VHA12_00970 [Candidatus Nanoarchaeia archaeon]|nr:hypothetical protein [Candidatus Nanoarchaeia archaeon]